MRGTRFEPQADKAKARQDELNAEIQASDDMVKNVNSRDYWAPVLDQILKAVPRSVQLTHVGAQAARRREIALQHDRRQRHLERPRAAQGGGDRAHGAQRKAEHAV